MVQIMKSNITPHVHDCISFNRKSINWLKHIRTLLQTEENVILLENTNFLF
ncbi:hypothetical protein HanIR_Chr15g0748581 [Helianthus annuus]|nr:hypothetical protein HanIR_Chr15g0748581 [Helianthus annuus]